MIKYVHIHTYYAHSYKFQLAVSREIFAAPLHSSFIGASLEQEIVGPRRLWASALRVTKVSMCL